MSQSILAIGDFSVRQHDGLFSLNDLHSAAGSAKRHEPNRFIRLANTKELIAALGACPEMGTPLQVINDGTNNGTYACRELVIAYAAWISAAFHLKVIRVFLAQQVEPVALPVPSLKNRLWLVSFNPIDGREIVHPVPIDAMVLTVPELCTAVLAGDIFGKDFRDLAMAVNQRQYQNACDNPNRGYGQEVADKIKGMSWSDLHIINQRASMEVWLRSNTTQKEAV